MGRWCQIHHKTIDPPCCRSWDKMQVDVLRSWTRWKCQSGRLKMSQLIPDAILAHHSSNILQARRNLWVLPNLLSFWKHSAPSQITQVQPLDARGPTSRHVGRLPFFTHGLIEWVVVCRNVCYWAGIVALSYTQDSTNIRNRNLLRHQIMID